METPLQTGSPAEDQPVGEAEEEGPQCAESAVEGETDCLDQPAEVACCSQGDDYETLVEGGVDWGAPLLSSLLRDFLLGVVS